METNELLDLEMIPVKQLEIDRRVQRARLDRKKVERIKLKFNQRALGFLTVSRRIDGQMVVIDGWHRYVAVMELSDGEGLVPCVVFTGLTVEQEAKMFLDLNETNQAHQMDKFQVRQVANDPAAVRVGEWLKEYGWTLSRGRTGPGYCSAVGTFDRVYRRSLVLGQLDLVPLTIMVVTRSWKLDEWGMKSVTFEGLSLVLARHGAGMDLQGQLIPKLRAYRGGPAALFNNAQQMANIRRIRPVHAVAGLVVETYNVGLRSNALPAWGQTK